MGPAASSYIQNSYDSLARLTATALHTPHGSPINQHAYGYNDGHQRTNQTFTAGNYAEYAYDKIGQLRRAKGWESGGTTPRLQEQFGYEYDAAWNLNRRTNNALVQTFNTDNRNQLSNATRSGTLTVAGTAGQRKAAYVGDYGVTNVTVSGTGLSSGAAELYVDGTWARTNATLADGNNTYTATGQDYSGRTSQDSVTVNLPATVTFQYDGNGNLTNDGRRIFEYDYENQLTNVYVANAWRSAFQYDALARRKSRKEYTWNSAWVLTNEVRYVYDGMLVVQERDANNLAAITYTRGDDLSGSSQAAGGIGGLLARTENPSTLNPQLSPSAHAYYHCDGNGNVTAIVSTNGIILARYHYDPFGNTLAMSGSLAEANSFRFSSKEWDRNAGMYYYGFRFYEPNLQRWPNRDPIGTDGGLNLYGFVGNNPMRYVDTDGRQFMPSDGYPRPQPPPPPRPYFPRPTKPYPTLPGGNPIPEQRWNPHTGDWETGGFIQTDDEPFMIVAPFCAARVGIGRGFVGESVAAEGEWIRQSAHIERATRKGARQQGVSIQEIYKNTKTGKTKVKHTVVDDKGRVVDQHFRPEYKPRSGDLCDGK